VVGGKYKELRGCGGGRGERAEARASRCLGVASSKGGANFRGTRSLRAKGPLGEGVEIQGSAEKLAKKHEARGRPPAVLKGGLSLSSICKISGSD